MVFDPTTAYANDYQWQNLVENLTWEVTSDTETLQYSGLKGRLDDTQTPDIQSVAAGIGLSSDAAAIVVWQPTTVTTFDFDPKPGHVLRRDAEEYEGWVISSVRKSRFNHWVCIVDKEVTNG